MKKTKLTPLFRPIIKDAFFASLRFRAFWAIAALAGLMGMGSVVGDVINQGTVAQRLPNINPFSPIGTLLAAKTEILQTLTAQTFLVTPHALLQTYIAIALLGLLATACIAACQCIVIMALPRVIAGRPVPTLASLRREITAKHIFRTIVIDLFTKVLLVDTFLLGNALFEQISKLPQPIFLPLFCVGFTLLTILCLIITITGFFALINAVNNDDSPATAWTSAWTMCQRHLIVCLEMSITQFALSFLGTLAYIFLMVFSAGLLTPVFALFFVNGSTVAITILFFAFMVCMAILTVAFGGLLTTLTYSIWITLQEVLERHRLPYPSRTLHHFRKK